MFVFDTSKKDYIQIGISGTIRPVFNVLDFGATGNGTSDDTAAIAAANAAAAVIGGTVYFPPGNYKISASINYFANVEYLGAAPPDDTSSNLTCSTIERFTANDVPIFTSVTGGNLRNVAWKNLVLRGLAKGASGGISTIINMRDGASHFFFENVTFRQTGGDGLTMAGTSFMVTMIHCESISITGDLIKKVSPNIGSLVILMNCITSGGGKLANLFGISGLVITGGGADTLDGGVMYCESCTAVAITGFDTEAAAGGTLDHAVQLVACRGLFSGNKFLNCGKADNSFFPLRLVSVSSMSVQANFFSGTKSTLAAISLASDAVGFAVRDNDLDKPIFGQAAATGPNLIANNKNFNFGVGVFSNPFTAGLDNRSGLTSADGSPITLYPVPTGAGQLFRVSIDIFATTVTGGTATYTLTWTENGGARTIAVSASVVNTLATLVDLINPDASTNITVQLTFAAFTGTLKVAGVAEQMA